MDSLPIGSNSKLLEVQTGNVHVVIKSKRPLPKVVNPSFLQQPSKVWITGADVKGIRICGEEKVADGDGALGASVHGIRTTPLFFEQTDYEIVVKSTDGKSVSLWHENYTVRERISPVTDSDDLISGVVNFGNSAGYSDFEISHNGKRHLVIRIEVFPSKISYKEDYQNMLEDISDEISGAVLDFMQTTYQGFVIDSTRGNMPAVFFQIVRTIFDKFQNAANTIIASPHHKLYVEHPVVPAHKVKKTDSQTLKWLQKHPENIRPMNIGFDVVKAPTVKKQITHNTVENQFTKFILKSTAKKLRDFRDRYVRSTRAPEQAVLDSVDTMTATLNKLVNTSFLREVDEYKATQSMSLVFEMAPGYRELYKYYLMMQHGLSAHGDVFKMSLKDTALLYEYWCFIKLVSLMKKNDYKLVSPDIIKVDNTGVTVTLVKGRKSEVVFINPRTGERIILSYNPAEHRTQTVNQRPDNVLELEKKGTSVPYKYVFDAKYRIESNPSDPFYPDEKPGPKVDDINTMHRYRDSIVYESKTPSRFMFEKTMFGAYVLFPYDDPDGDYKDHRFYKSIETVNIGGLPFLPGTTELVETFLSDLIADSPESAFERASLPRGIEDRLEKMDWSVKDVMVGTVRTREQLEFNLEKKGYYVPARFITVDNLPVRYIALYEQDLGSESGIRYYGEVLTAQRIRRRLIPVPMRPGANPEETYYYFTVRQWEQLEQKINIKDSDRGRPRFTNKFLLDNCTESYQLFAISSEEQYRLMTEMTKAYKDVTADTTEENTAAYRVSDTCSVVVSGGYFIVANDKGETIDRISISAFGKSPRAGFNRIKKSVIRAKIEIPPESNV